MRVWVARVPESERGKHREADRHICVDRQINRQTCRETTD